MRDYRDSKAMAQTLRDSLTTKAITISHSESLEFVSKMLGVANWNTLSALLQSDRRDGVNPAVKREAGAGTYPAIPLRDLVPFPTAVYPIFVGREKTKRALKEAFERHREVVIAIQKEGAVDEPGFEDVYEVGVLAQLLDVERLSDGTLRVLLQVHRRVMIRSFTNDTGGFQVACNDVTEGPIPDAPELIKKAVEQFESYAAARDIGIPQTWPPLDQIRDPGRVADLICAHVAMPVSQKQRLLATLDPVARLRQIDSLINGAPDYTTALTATRKRALDYANQRKHRHATLEHLLLALLDDEDASAAMLVCGADLGAMQAKLLRHLDNDLTDLVVENGGDAKFTPAVQRVVQRAALNGQEMGSTHITGAHTLRAIFPEARSIAVRCLVEQGLSEARVSAATSDVQGIGKKA